MNIRFLCGGAALLLLAGCASNSSRLIGSVRPPINPEQVRVYKSPPPHYEEIATLDASSAVRFFHGSSQTNEEAIQRLKEEAARVGANGVLLTLVGDEPSGSIGIGVGGGGYASSRSAVSGGASGAAPLVKTGAHGLAIYVPGQP